VGSILIIEDDPFLGPGLVRFMEKQEYCAHLEKRGARVLKNLGDLIASFDLFVLDLMLPDIPGEEILKRTKIIAPEKPVIVLTAKVELKNKEECFTKGADDYLVKPFEIRELLLRIQALLRRSGLTNLVRIGDACLNVRNGTLTRDNKEHVLSRRSLALLRCLLENRGRVVSKEEIMRVVWNDTVVTEESIRTYIKELRKILPEDSIKTFKGRGYLLN